MKGLIQRFDDKGEVIQLESHLEISGNIAHVYIQTPKTVCWGPHVAFLKNFTIHITSLAILAESIQICDYSHD